ncbi:MAG: phosphoserine phosphatase SerB [Neisseriaceae bacterium]|nr:phosphoserine phosphatase SerB [Neisseriaceae bacterium]MBR1819565.1 phosphoserine phosphatase SerB [Neisseriaceae bacterium]
MNTVFTVFADHLHTRLPENILTALPKPYFQDEQRIRIAVEPDFRLPENIKHELNQAQIDYALLPDMAFSDLGLIVSDMDSTLITIECVDEIAARLGIKPQVAAITERAMRGEIDFRQSLKERVALLKGLPISELQTVYDEVLKLTPGAEELLDACHQFGVKFMLVSGGFTFFTDRLKQRLGLDYTYANVLGVANGKLTGEVDSEIIDAQRKVELLQQYQADLGLSSHQVLAVGDGANDIPMIQAAGIGIAFHAKPKTQAAAKVSVNFGGLNALVRMFR